MNPTECSPCLQVNPQFLVRNGRSVCGVIMGFVVIIIGEVLYATSGCELEFEAC